VRLAAGAAWLVPGPTHVAGELGVAVTGEISALSPNRPARVPVFRVESIAATKDDMVVCLDAGALSIGRFAGLGVVLCHRDSPAPPRDPVEEGRR
jgi:hypothetical protein